jgi:hypothetical protein
MTIINSGMRLLLLQLVLSSLELVAHALPEYGKMRGRGRLSVGVVQHTHSVASAPSLERGRRQLMDWNTRGTMIEFHHHVVFWADNASTCPSMLAALNFSTNVACTGSNAIAVMYPGLDRITYLRGHGLYTNELRHNVYNRQWAWNNCDADYLWWFRAVDVASTYDYYWFLEWDLAWRGDLGSMLAYFHGVPYLDRNGTLMEGSSRNEDLLCDTTSTGHHGVVTRRSPHKWKRNMSHFEYGNLRQCSQQLVRMSHRLIKRVVSWSMNPSDFIFCEMRAGTMCNMSTFGTASGRENCTLGGFNDGPQKRFFDHSTFNWLVLMQHQLSPEDLADRTAPDKFFHRYKWGSWGCKGQACANASQYHANSTNKAAQTGGENEHPPGDQ